MHGFIVSFSDYFNQFTPKRVAALRDHTIISAAGGACCVRAVVAMLCGDVRLFAGAQHSLALSANGHVRHAVYIIVS
jgi:hypothetical protein